MPMETRHDLEHTTERLTNGLRCPWKWGLYYVGQVGLANTKGVPKFESEHTRYLLTTDHSFKRTYQN